MSDGEPAGAPAPRARLAIVAVLALLGAFIGLLWGIADTPLYRTQATVVPAAGESPDLTELQRYAQIAASRRVSETAADLIGADVAGADLLSEVVVAPAADGSSLVVEATSEMPDFAVAAADGYSEALVRVAGRGEKGRSPLQPGAAAVIPDEPSENRSGLLWSLIGLLAGLLAGAAIALIAARRSVRARRPVPPEGARGREGAWLEGALGAPLIAAFDDPDPLLSPPRGGEAPDLDEEKLASYRDALGSLGLDGDAGPKTLAVMALGGDCDVIGVALGLAAAAAEDGLRVIVVETDLAAPALAARLGVRPSPGLRDYLNRDAGPRDVMRSLPAASASGPIVCVPAGEQDGRPARIAGRRFEGLAERLPRVYDLVLFCAPPLLADADAAAVAAVAGGVVAVAPAAESASSSVTRAARVLRPERPLGTISTRT